VRLVSKANEMNSEKFVESIKRHVINAAIADTITNLKNPPGRKVPPEEKARSNWYNQLSDVELAQGNSIISDAIYEGIFGLLAVLDGVRSVSDENGVFELTYQGSDRVLLNDPESISLHDLLNSFK
jgi:hypothetical protein